MRSEKPHECWREAYVKKGIIGIDLGTTNTAAAWVAMNASARVQTVPMLQHRAPGELAPRDLLPSVVFVPHAEQWPAEVLSLPWNATPAAIVGDWARAQAVREPDRVVVSSKSWLAHAHIDRAAAILPWGAVGEHKMSPVRAAMHVLAHVKGAYAQWASAASSDGTARPAWDDNDIIITVPASFDEAARDLTLAAAARAGLGDVILLEEPMAAFYAYLADVGTQGISRDQVILVVDVGGGTTDFTLLRVDESGQGFVRVAVGEHLLLGGDNMDLALAKQIEQRWADEGKTLDALQWQSLTHGCRTAKERLLAADAPMAVPVTVSGRGSRLVGATYTAELRQTDVLALVQEGFFPLVERGALPARARTGLSEFGLPYAADAAITKHLSAFLQRHQFPRIDAVLFNGGAMTPAVVRERVVATLAAWQRDRPRELVSPMPDASVARGAARYGLVRHGLIERIRGGSPRCYYVGMAEGERTVAACVASRGLEEGMAVRWPEPVALVTNRPVSFRLFADTVRQDEVGTRVAIEQTDTLHELPPLVTVVRARGSATQDVTLETRLTELGALELHCVDASGARHRLAFSVRGGATSRAPTTDPMTAAAVAIARAAVTEGGARLAGVMRELEAAIGQRRDEWSLPLLRGLFDALIPLAPERARNADVEQRLIGLLGFCVRPGRGAAADEFRAKQVFGLHLEGPRSPKNDAVRTAYWVMLRRAAAGLTAGQQAQLSDRVQSVLLRQGNKTVERSLSATELMEQWRLVCSLEALPVVQKRKYADEIMRRIAGTASSAGSESTSSSAGTKGTALNKAPDPQWFALLGRIAARQPWFGSLDGVLAPSVVESYLERLLQGPREPALLSVATIARKTGDRARDIAEPMRQRVLAWLGEGADAAHARRLVEDIVPADAAEEKLALGDALPPGFVLTAPS